MFLRLVVLLIAVVSYNAYSDWEENQFDIRAIASHLNFKNQRSTSTESNFGIAINAIKLFDGWGVSAANTSLYVLSQDEQEETFHNRHSSLQLKSFISENTDIQLGYYDYSTLNTSGVIATNFLLEPKTQFIDTRENLVSRVNLGNDQDYWVLKLGISAYSSKAKDLISEDVFKQLESELVDLSLAWRISEDSYLTSKIFYVSSQNSQLTVKNSSTIRSSFIGFKTHYLGSSVMSLDIGNSKVIDGQNSFSWQLNHTTNISDYFSLALGNGRRFAVSGDFRFDSDLQTTTVFNVSVKPSEYLSVVFDGSLIEGVIGDSIKTETIALKNGYTLNYTANWSGELYIQHNEYKDDRDIFDYKQTQVGIILSRDLI